MIDSNTMIDISLNAQQWNTVLEQLSTGPYRVVAPLISAIQQQCLKHETNFGANNEDVDNVQQH
jgi:hypothetical protein